MEPSQGEGADRWGDSEGGGALEREEEAEESMEPFRGQ